MKKIICFILVISVFMSLSTSAFAADISSNVSTPDENMRVLYILTENIRVVAPGSQIDEYLNAETDQEKNQLLSKMKADPKAIITDINQGELGFISVDSDDVSESIATPSNERTTGKWVLDNFEIEPDQIMRISRSGGVKFTLEDGDILKIYLEFEGTRTFGVRTEDSTPTFLAGDYFTHERAYHCDVVGLPETGQNRVFVYVKNVSAQEMVVLAGSYIRVY